MQQQVVRGFGYTNYLFFAVSVIAVLVFFLNSAKNCGELAAFCQNAIFMIVFIASMAMLLLLSWIVGWPAQYSHGSKGGKFEYRSVSMYFLEDVTLLKLAYVPLAMGGVFFVSYLAIQANSPLAGILVSGFIMQTVFFLTNSAVPVILIHGGYNAGVVFLRQYQQYQFLSASPINVPEVGFRVFDQRVVNEMLSQVLLVAPAEELFKIFMTTVFFIVIKLKFDYSGLWSKVLSGGASVGIWAVYHLEIAIR